VIHIHTKFQAGGTKQQGTLQQRIHVEKIS